MYPFSFTPVTMTSPTFNQVYSTRHDFPSVGLDLRSKLKVTDFFHHNYHTTNQAEAILISDKIIYHVELYNN